jgi:hypothetical protein
VNKECVGKLRLLQRSAHHTTTSTHLVEKLCQGLVGAVVSAELADAIGDECLGKLDKRATLPLSLVVTSGSLCSTREGLDSGEALDAVLCTERLVLVLVAVNIVKGDEGSERRGGRREFRSERLAVSAPGRLVAVCLVSSSTHQGATKATI